MLRWVLCQGVLTSCQQELDSLISRTMSPLPLLVQMHSVCASIVLAELKQQASDYRLKSIDPVPQ